MKLNNTILRDIKICGQIIQKTKVIVIWDKNEIDEIGKETLKISGNVHLFKSGVRHMWCSLHFYTSYLTQNFLKSYYIVKSSQDLVSKVTFNGF